jgi:hypothetical protein
VNDEFESIWKEAILAYSKYHLRIFLKELRKTTTPVPVRITMVSAEILKSHIPNMRREMNRYINPLGMQNHLSQSSPPPIRHYITYVNKRTSLIRLTNKQPSTECHCHSTLQIISYFGTNDRQLSSRTGVFIAEIACG